MILKAGRTCRMAQVEVRMPWLHPIKMVGSGKTIWENELPWANNLRCYSHNKLRIHKHLLRAGPPPTKRLDLHFKGPVSSHLAGLTSHTETV